MPLQYCSSCCSSSSDKPKWMTGPLSTLSLLLVLQCTLIISTQASYAARFPNDDPQQPSQAGEVQLFQQNLRQAADSPVIMTAGDSITAFGYEKDGWVTLLQQQYPDVIFMNKGMHQGTTKGALNMLREVTTSRASPLVQNPERVKLITLCYGANDASTRANDATWRYVPLAEYKSNLMQMIDGFRSRNPAPRVVLLTPPPAASPPRNDRRLEVTAEYAQAVQQIGRTLDVPVVDLFQELVSVPGWQTQVMLPDGLHLNPAGQQLMFGAVLPVVREALQDV